MNNVTNWQPTPGMRDGNWVWDGTRWVCDPDCSVPTPCPPLGPPVFSGPQGQPPWYPGANGGVSFGSTAPPNPVRGHFWWDGQTLWLFDGATWEAIGGSGATQPAVVAVGPTAPVNPMVGTLWFNGSQLAVWNGMTWFVLAGATVPSGTPPDNPQPGQQWFNGTTLYVWDGIAWVPVSQTKTSIQATPPSGPNPGDLWFDGTQLHIWDGTTWELVGPGATVGPVPTTTQAFKLLQNANLTVSTSTWTIVPFASTPPIDLYSGWNASSHKFQPNKAGNYFVTMRGFGDVAASGGFGEGIALNDVGTIDATANWVAISQLGIESTTPFSDLYSASGMVFLNGTTDFLRIWGFSASGTLRALGGSVPAFEAWLLP